MFGRMLKELDVFLQATSYKPQAILPATVTTTYHAPDGHTGPPPRRDKRTTRYKPQATCRCFVIPTKRAEWLAQAVIQTGAVSATRGGYQKRR